MITKLIFLMIVFTWPKYEVSAKILVVGGDYVKLTENMNR